MDGSTNITRSGGGLEPASMQRAALAVTPVASALAHAFDSTPAVVAWAVAIEFISAFGWLAVRCSGRATPSGAVRFERALAACLLAAATVLALIHSIDAAAAAIALYVLGTALVTAYGRTIRTILADSDEPRRLARRAIGVVLALVLIGTVLLALPAATHPAVPDYGHNFWRHVSACAFMSASAVSLCGASIYNVGEDLRPFGQAVLFGLTGGGAILFAALGLIALRPWLRTAVSLRSVLAGWIGLQMLTVAVIARAAPTTYFDGRAPWWTGAFIACGAMDQSAFALRQDGLARGVTVNSVFWPALGSMLAGSLGLVVLIDRAAARLAGRRGRVEQTGDLSSGEFATGARSEPASVPHAAASRAVDLAGIELHAGIWILCLSAGLLFLFESEGLLPRALYLERPLDLGANQVPLREMHPATRWRAALLLAAGARSAGQHVVPLDPGAISVPGWLLMLGLMWIGGAVGSFAGGARIGTLAALLYRGELARQGLGRVPQAALRILLASSALTVAAAAILALFQDGASAWSLVTEAVSLTGCVGVNTGLTPHLQWPCRVAMIVAMLAGKLIPALGWCAIAAAVRRGERPAMVEARAAPGA